MEREETERAREEHRKKAAEEANKSMRVRMPTRLTGEQRERKERDRLQKEEDDRRRKAMEGANAFLKETRGKGGGPYDFRM